MMRTSTRGRRRDDRKDAQCRRVCIGANRFYAHEDIADDFAEKFAAAMSALKLGPGLNDGVDVGPLVNASTRDKVAHLVDDAVAKGARVLTGGKRPDGPGFFYEPTVLVDIEPQSDILHTEIFGPVAPIVRFQNLSDVITPSE